MNESPLARSCKNRTAVHKALAVFPLALALSACGSQTMAASEMDEKLRRAEAAAQKAIAAQQAAESAVARIRRAENEDRRGDGEDEASNYQETGPAPLAGNDEQAADNNDNAQPAPDA